MAVTQLEIDCALMAGVADRATRPNKINRFPVPSGWVEMTDDYETRASGFEAIYFKKGDQIVISFAGTNTNFLGNDGLGDLITDIEGGLGNATTQLVQAAEYYMYVKNNNPEVTEFIFTGHSLGGGLAALMGEFFNEKAIVFDPAPFANAADVNVKMAILDHLQGIPYQYVDPYSGNVMMIDRPRLYSKKYNLDEINILAQDLLGFTNETVAARTLNVSGYYMQGEFCRYFPFADEFLNASNEIKHNVPGIGGDCRPWGWPLKLHSLSLLTAFMIDNRLSELTAKIPGLLDMLFDSRLYCYAKKAEKENILERLVRHQAGNAPLNGGGLTEADNMLTRFTNDLQKIADQGDLSTDERIIKTLTAAAMQMYYENPNASGASNNTKELFDVVTGGLHFDRTDVVATLDKARGYNLYLRNYLDFLLSADMDLSAVQTIKKQLPDLLQWYIQVGSVPMTATAINERFFMLGGNDVILGDKAHLYEHQELQLAA